MERSLSSSFKMNPVMQRGQVPRKIKHISHVGHMTFTLLDVNSSYTVVQNIIIMA